VSQGIALQTARPPRTEKRPVQGSPGGVFEQQFVQQLLVAFTPQIKALIKEVLADAGREPLIVDYEEAGRMIGTTYEGVRKLVRSGKLTAVSRSGRHRGIAVAELRDYVQRSQLIPEWQRELALSGERRP
jgi:hypothetical protein